MPTQAWWAAPGNRPAAGERRDRRLIDPLDTKRNEFVRHHYREKEHLHVWHIVEIRCSLAKALQQRRSGRRCIIQQRTCRPVGQEIATIAIRHRGIKTANRRAIGHGADRFRRQGDPLEITRIAWLISRTVARSHD